MKSIYILFIVSILSSCGGEIKNDDVNIEIEEGTDFSKEEIVEEKSERKITNSIGHVQEMCIGFWVGDFEPDYSSDDERDKKNMYLDEGYMWNRNNKINISIDEVRDDIVIGHSVVAGNDRPFEGKIVDYTKSSYTIKVVEPGDDKYDGEFSFTISDGRLMGKWKAYKKLNISERKYELKRRTYAYDPSVKLEMAKPYADWKNVSKEKIVENYDDEMYEWIKESYAGATNIIYELNASEKLLKTADVENLKRGDLQIIRNTIYARHGYSYKNRVYRVFFDAQPWYIPVHTDIKQEFTDIEKKNIQLLLRYEKNAEEYYDSFGRG